MRKSRFFTTGMGYGLCTWLFFVSCFGSMIEPMRHYYTLHLQPLQTIQTPHGSGFLRINDLTIESSYDRVQMVMRRSPFELFYKQREVWAVKPNRMISNILVHTLANQTMFAEVARELGDKRPDYVLSGELRAIEIEEQADTWFAHIALSLQISHFESGEILWTFHVDDRKQVVHGDFSLAVQALSEIMSTGIEQALLSMQKIPWK